MSGKVSFSYQFYRDFLYGAAQQEEAGKLEAARDLYLNAAKSLLQVAKGNTGKIREEQLREVEQLYQKAASLAEKDSTPDKQKASPRSKGGDAGDFSPEPIPDVSFDDIAGLENVKHEVRERVIQPMNNPDLYRRFRIKPGGGILMFGLPGTGKTMISRAIAHEVQAPFFHIRCSDIKDRWVGATEQNIAALFSRVRQEKAAVLFFDEFDGLGSRVDEGSSHMRGMQTELKSQMDGFDKESTVTLLLLAATNHPWDIDTPFIRAGRFTKMIYIPLPDSEARRFLLHHQFTGLVADQGFDYDAIVRITDGFSGADIEQFAYSVKIRAVTRSMQEGKDSMITEEDVYSAREQFRSTVMRSDIGLMREFMQNNHFRIPERM